MAADVVDELQLEINAKASKANDAIDRLVGKLDRLTASLSIINVSGLNNLSVGVRNLGNSMQTMNNIKTADFTRLAKNLTSLNNVDVSKLTNLSSNITKISTAFSGLSGLDKAAEQMGMIANGIKQLGYKSADKAITNIPLLASAMKKLMAELSTAPRVSQNLIDMTNALAKLARTGASSGKAANSLISSFNGVSRASAGMKSGLIGVVNGMTSVRRSILQAMGIAGGFYAVIQGIKSAIDISSDLTEVQNVVDVTFGDYKSKIEDLAKVSIPELGMSELTAKQIGSRFQAMGTAMGFAQGKMADMSVELTRLAGDMASFYNVEQGEVAKSLQSIFTGETEPLRKYGLDLTNATIQEWAMKQGIDANVNSMTQMQKTALRYQYVLENTSAAQGDFIRTSDTWANQVRVLKENIKALASVIGSSFINALKPLVKALNVAMGYIIDFAKVVSNSLGKIFGWKYEDATGGIANDFSDMSDSADDLADGTGKAADNAKKLKQQLQGFDELNVLTTNDNSGKNKNSGSGNGIGSGGATGGQWTQTDGILKDYESDLDTLYKLGSHISKTLIDAMESIDWDSVYEKARGFGKGLADFLNGLFADQNGITLFGEIGKTIASALNTVIYSALSFGQTFDFKQFGYNIADGINNFFRTFDFGSLAQTINVWVDGIFDAIKTIIKETDWGEVLNGLKDFFENLEIDTVGVIIGALIIKKILKTNILSSAISAIGTNLATKIKLSFSKTISSFGGIAGILKMDIGTALGAGTFSEIAALIGTGIVGSLVAWFVGQEVGKLIGRLIFPEDAEWYKDFSWFGDGGFFKTVFEDISTSLQALGAMFLDFFKIPGVVNFSSMILSLIGNPLAALGVKIFGLTKDNSFKEWFETKISPWLSSTLWETSVNVISIAFKNEWNKFLSWWNSFGIVSWWNQNVKPWFTLEKWESLGKNIQNGIKNKWNEFTNWWKSTGIYAWYENHVKPWFSPNKWSFSGIADGIKTAFSNAISAVKQLWNSFAKTLNSYLKISLQPIVISGKTIFSGGTLNLGVIPTFAQGGFPEDGWFRASQGEMLGKFDNGKSVVANNNQITNGISDAVQKGNQQMISYMQQEIEELRQQNNYLMQIASKNFGITKDQIGQNARDWAREYTTRTGNEAYSF